MVRSGVIIQAFVLILLATKPVTAQDIEAQMIYTFPILSNPALTGSEGDGKLRLVYRDYYPGLGLQFGSVYASYDTYSERLHGGAGLYILDNILGNIMNEIRAGGTYAYHLRATQDFYINAGFQVSVIHRGFKAGNLVLPEHIDPLLGPVLSGSEVLDLGFRTFFDMGIGFLFSYLDYHAGLSIIHISNPDLTGAGTRDSRLGRRYTAHASASFQGSGEELGIYPFISYSHQDGSNILSTGLSVSYKILSTNFLSHINLGQASAAMQAGLHVNLGSVELGYNYFFDPFNSGPLNLLTLSNQISLTIGLNIVDKRGLIKAIKYPKL